VGVADEDEALRIKTSWPSPFLNEIRPAIPAKTPSEYAKIIKKCWNGEASKRPLLDNILQYFNGELGNTETV